MKFSPTEERAWDIVMEILAPVEAKIALNGLEAVVGKNSEPIEWPVAENPQYIRHEDMLPTQPQ